MKIYKRNVWEHLLWRGSQRAVSNCRLKMNLSQSTLQKKKKLHYMLLITQDTEWQDVFQCLLLADDTHYLYRAIGLVWSPPGWI